MATGSRRAPSDEGDERDFRGPGCTARCREVRAIVPGRYGRSDLLLHDPESHETYGRVTAMPPDPSTAIVWTGALVIDRWARSVASYGHDVYLTEREYEIVDYLAANLGRLSSADTIARAVLRTDWDSSHLLRVHMSRLRGRLGASAALIETVKGRGYRLLEAAPVETTPADEPLVAPRPWARDYACCVCCGRTAPRHAGYGRCAHCTTKQRMLPHIGPCGAQPAHGRE